MLHLLSLGHIQERTPRRVISGVRDAVLEFIDGRAFTRLRSPRHHWVKVAGGNDTSLRKIKVVPPDDVANSALGLYPVRWAPDSWARRID